MRLSPGLLLVAIAFVVPIVVEFRTVAAWFGIEITPLETVALGVVMVVALVAYAFWPQREASNPG